MLHDEIIKEVQRILRIHFYDEILEVQNDNVNKWLVSFNEEFGGRSPMYLLGKNSITATKVLNYVKNNLGAEQQ